MNVFSGEFVLRFPAYLITVCGSFLCRRSIRRNFDNSVPRHRQSLGGGPALLHRCVHYFVPRRCLISSATSPARVSI